MMDITDIGIYAGMGGAATILLGGFLGYQPYSLDGFFYVGLFLGVLYFVYSSIV